MNKGQKSPDSLPFDALLEMSLALLIAVSSVQLPARYPDSTRGTWPLARFHCVDRVVKEKDRLNAVPSTVPATLTW